MPKTDITIAVSSTIGKLVNEGELVKASSGPCQHDITIVAGHIAVVKDYKVVNFEAEKPIGAIGLEIDTARLAQLKKIKEINGEQERELSTY